MNRPNTKFICLIGVGRSGAGRLAAALTGGLLLLAGGPALAQTNTDVVYDDTLGAEWTPDEWRCSNPAERQVLVFDEHDVVKTGTNAIELRFTCSQGYGGLGMDRRLADWSQVFRMYPNQYRTVSFDFYCADDTTDTVANLLLTLDVGGSARILDYIQPALQPKEWRRVEIPLAECNPNREPFARLIFFNDSSTQHPHVYVDNIALTWAADTTPPVISAVNVTNIGWTTATLLFKTDEYARCALFLGTGGPLLPALTNDDFAVATVLVLSNLLPNTTYQFRIEASDHQVGGAPPNTSAFAGTFTTMATNILPVLGPVTVTNIHAESATIQWPTVLPADSTVEYGEGAYTATATHGAFTTNHVVTLVGLKPQTSYQYRVKVRDPYGNTAGYEANPPLTFTTTSPLEVALQADPATTGRPFTAMIRGVNMGGWWTFSYSNPYPNDSPKLRELTRLIKPGVLRHEGGLASNHIFWDRSNRQMYPNGWQGTNFSCRSAFNPPLDGTNYTSGGGSEVITGAYSVSYQADEIDNLAAFAHYVGADVMIEVNVNTADPAMWADMVHYANVEHNHGFRFWELGNELDLVHDNPAYFAPTEAFGQEYVDRYKRYYHALKAVDPTIRIMGPTTAGFQENSSVYTDFIDPLTQDGEVQAQQMLDLLSFHYYPRWNGSQPVTWSDMFAYGPTDYFRSRAFATAAVAPKRPLLDSRNLTHAGIAITEFNAIAADAPTLNNLNHANALYMADMLARLAAAGADMVCHWELFDATSGPNPDLFGLIDNTGSFMDVDGQGNLVLVRDTFQPNPVYYAYFLYAQLFGDQLVAGSSSAPDTVSLWASLDTANPGRVYALAVNLNDESVKATFGVNGLVPRQTRVWTLANPSFAAAQDKDAVAGGTSINGLQIDATSAATIIASAQAIVDSGLLLTNSSTPFSCLLPPFSATVFRMDTGAPAPQLTLTLTATNTVLLSWPSPATGFVLEQNSTLAGANWVPAPQPVVDDGTTRSVAVPVSGANLFFRLRK